MAISSRIVETFAPLEIAEDTDHPYEFTALGGDVEDSSVNSVSNPTENSTPHVRCADLQILKR